jgi:hypothetical protein
VNESRLQVGREREDGCGDDDEVVKSMAATTGLHCRLNLAMVVECVFSLFVSLECHGCLHNLYYVCQDKATNTWYG